MSEGRSRNPHLCVPIKRGRIRNDGRLALLLGRARNHLLGVAAEATGIRGSTPLFRPGSVEGHRRL
jgi:hypothetical protein